MPRYMDENDDYEGPDTSGLWYASLKRAIGSARGQKLLLEIKAALEAMPEHRLIEGQMSDGAAVCAVGAIAAYRLVAGGATWADAIASLHYTFDDEAYLYETVDYATMNLKMARTIAWELANANDYRYGNMTPEGRWTAVMGWVTSKIVTVEV